MSSPTTNEHDSHGHSVAAWTGVTVLLVASALLAVAVFFGIGWLVWLGVAMTVVGVLGWYGMEQIGLGSRAGGHR